MGWYDSGGKRHGFGMRHDGAFTTVDFPDPNTTNTTLYKISASGVVGGTAWLSSGAVYGLLWKNGVVTQVDYPGAVATMIHGLNSEGEFCGMEVGSKANFAGRTLERTEQLQRLPFKG